MSAFIKLILFILTAGVMPVLTGLFPVSFLPLRSRRLPWIILSGYLATFALFEVAGLPILLFTTFGDFMLLTGVFTAADVLLIALGIFRCARTGGIRLPRAAAGRSLRIGDHVLCVRADGTVRVSDHGEDRPILAPDPDVRLFWLLFALLLIYELYRAFTLASYDGDDAYYVAQSVQTWQTGTMYYYIPYTGWTTSIDGRHAMAMIPIWISYIATLTGTHPTIVTHSLMPLVLIPLVDVCFYCAAAELTAGQPQDRQRRMLPAIMIIVTVLQIFGNVSIYTPETFLLMRTWQGKSLFANLILPTALLLLLRWTRVNRELILERAGRRGRRGRAGRAPQSVNMPRAESAARSEEIFFWLMIVLLGLASGFCTSLAPAILTVLLLGAAFLMALLLHRKRMLPYMLLACIPNYVYLVLLLRMMNSQWFSFLQGGRLP